MHKATVAAAILALSAAPLSAGVLECAINAGASQNGFITDHYSFEYDSKTATVSVLDALLQGENGGPLAGTLSETAKKLGISWSIVVVTTTGKNIRMQYRASYVKATKAVQISVVPGGGEYVGGFEARGTCN
jgi:hypothetical protein